MRTRTAIIAAAVATGLACAAAPAHACPVPLPLDLDDIWTADAVVIGRISNYRIIPRVEARTGREQSIPRGTSARHAVFDVTVDEILLGNPPRTFQMDWNNDRFAEPKTMAAGPYLIALRATLPTAPFRPMLTDAPFLLLQQDCSRPFLLETGGAEAARARAMLSGIPRRQPR